METSTPEEDDKPSLEITETSTTATGTASEDSAKKETASTEETLTKKEKETTPQVTGETGRPLERNLGMVLWLKIMCFQTTSYVKGHFKSGTVPLYRSLVTPLRKLLIY